MAPLSLDPAHFTPEYLAEYDGDPVVAITGVCIILNTAVVALRLLARRLQAASYGWDDGLALLSWALNLGLAIVILLNLQFGGGHHIEYLIVHPDLHATSGLLDLVVEPILYLAAVAFAKLAILVLYLRIFAGRFIRSIIWVIIGITILSTIINTFLVGFQCQPVSKAWDPFEPGHCHDIVAHWIWGSFPNILTDFVMLLLPIPSIWRLEAPLHTRFGLLLTFAVGSLGMVMAITRWVEFKTSVLIIGDGGWYDNPLVIWGMIEPTAYLMSACLLTCRTLWENIAVSRLGSRVHSLLLRSRLVPALKNDRYEKSASGDWSESCFRNGTLPNGRACVELPGEKDPVELPSEKDSAHSVDQFGGHIESTRI